MKHVEIKDLLKKELLIVQLPNRTTDFSVVNNDEATLICAFHEYEGCLKMKEIPKGYSLLGKADEIREYDAEPLVHKNELGYTNYNVKTASQAVFSKFPTATESLLSAIESEIYWKNPLGEEPILEAICCGNLQADAWGYPQCCGVPNATEESIELHSMWHEAELRTFDKSRTLIFVKN